MAASQTGYTLTYVQDSFDDWGRTRTTLFQVAPTASSYFTSGYQITPANVGMRTFIDVVVATQIPAGGTPLTTMVVPIFDITNNALQLFEVQATGSLATLTFTGNPASLTGTFAGNPGGLTGTATNPLINLAAGGTASFGAVDFAVASSILMNGTAGSAFTGITGVQAPTITIAAYTPGGTVTMGAYTPGGTVAGGSFVGSKTTLVELASAADASGFVFLLRFFGN